MHQKSIESNAADSNSKTVTYPDKIVNSDFEYPQISEECFKKNSAGGWSTYVQISPDSQTCYSLRFGRQKLGADFDVNQFGWRSTQTRETADKAAVVGDIQFFREIETEDKNQYVELISNEEYTYIYQDISTPTPNYVYKWQLDHCSRIPSRIDSMSVKIGAPGKEEVQTATRTTSNGNGKIGEEMTLIKTDDSQFEEKELGAGGSGNMLDFDRTGWWETYEGVYVSKENQPVTRFTFTDIGGSAEGGMGGNCLDNISFAICHPLYYDLNGGKNDSILIPEESGRYPGYHPESSIQNLSDEVPERDGYTFLGWSSTFVSDVTSKEQLDELELIDKIEIKAGENHVYAVWAENPLVTFEYADGTPIFANRYIFANEFSYPSLPNPKTGFHYEWSEPVSRCYSSKKIVLSIVPNSYTVSFEGNGADSGTMNDITVLYEDELSLPECEFEKGGYYFSEWNTESDGSGQSYFAGSVTSKLSSDEGRSITLYAQWKPTDSDLLIQAAANIDGKGSAKVSWPTYDYRNKNFKVYQQPAEAEQNDASVWTSVGLDYRDVTLVRCLQIYPCEEAATQLEEWIEDSGYGKNKISVTPISFTEFNDDPEGKLKTNNSWDYDVVFIGCWDANGYYPDITDNARKQLRAFSKSGRGIIFGHDTIYEAKMPNLGGLANELLDFHWAANSALLTPTYTGNPEHGVGLNGKYPTSKIRIENTGLLTNYPWEVGSKGDILEVPTTHINAYWYSGKIWMRFWDETYTEYDMTYPSNAYCVTSNNTAWISTGHSNGKASEDEQKILANLIFYMNQLTFNASTLKDASAQDTTAPDLFDPIKDSQNATLTLQAQDKGNSYRYKASAYDKEDTSESGWLTDSKNVAEVNVTTKTRTMRYIVDDEQDKIITLDTEGYEEIEADENEQCVIDYSQYRGKYLHVAAIDGAKNISETKTIYVPNLFEVTIRDDMTGDIVNVQQVEEGNPIDETIFTLPTPPFGWAFKGYMPSVDKITEDCEIVAQYEYVAITLPDTGEIIVILNLVGIGFLFIFFGLCIQKIPYSKDKEAL